MSLGQWTIVDANIIFSFSSQLGVSNALQLITQQNTQPRGMLLRDSGGLAGSLSWRQMDNGGDATGDVGVTFLVQSANVLSGTFYAFTRREFYTTLTLRKYVSGVFHNLSPDNAHCGTGLDEWTVQWIADPVRLGGTHIWIYLSNSLFWEMHDTTTPISASSGQGFLYLPTELGIGTHSHVTTMLSVTYARWSAVSAFVA